MDDNAISPNEYDKRINSEIKLLQRQLDLDIKLEKARRDDEINAIKKAADTIIDNIEKDTAGNRSRSVVAISFSLSIVVFLYVLMFTDFSFCSSYETVSNYAESVGVDVSNSGGKWIEFMMIRQFGIPGVVFVASFLLFLVAGSILAYFRHKKQRVEAKGQIDKIDDIRLQSSDAIGEMKRKFQLEIEGLSRKKKEYRAEYEKNRRAESAKYADSAVAQEVVDMLANGFRGHIEASDRRPHVEEIVVPFSFRVYAEKIDTPYGVYDFELKRVARLAGMNEQAALANAIAQNVHTQIMTEYPVDPSGGEVDPLEITVRYGADWVEESMTYRAVNGLYVPERSF